MAAGKVFDTDAQMEESEETFESIRLTGFGVRKDIKEATKAKILSNGIHFF
jgi:hypothetical protein